MSSIILGIETSCDETSAAVVEDGKRVLSNVVSSQIEFHQKYGGVVPEVASRRHLEAVLPVIDEALSDAGLTNKDLSAIAVTVGPGLIGALLIGLAAAKALCYAWSLPLIGVNHLEAHIYANFLEDPDLKPPVVCLVVSGGHTVLAFIDEDSGIHVLGETLDDAAGEAFDKIARFLGLGYPGGPAIDALAKEGDPAAIQFPRAMMDRTTYDFSLSGLKTAVINYVNKAKKEGREIDLPDIAASFQAAVIDVQIAKILRAADEYHVKTVMLAGGVAANTALRDRLTVAAKKKSIAVRYPSMLLCTDNAAMIAGLAYRYLMEGKTLSFDTNADANLRLKDVHS